MAPLTGYAQFNLTLNVCQDEVSTLSAIGTGSQQRGHRLLQVLTPSKCRSSGETAFMGPLDSQTRVESGGRAFLTEISVPISPETDCLVPSVKLFDQIPVGRLPMVRYRHTANPALLRRDCGGEVWPGKGSKMADDGNTGGPICAAGFSTCGIAETGLRSLRSRGGIMNKA